MVLANSRSGCHCVLSAMVGVVLSLAACSDDEPNRQLPPLDVGLDTGDEDTSSNDTGPFLGTCLEPLIACMGAWPTDEPIACVFDDTTGVAEQWFADGRTVRSEFTANLTWHVEAYNGNELCYSVVVSQPEGFPGTRWEYRGPDGAQFLYELDEDGERINLDCPDGQADAVHRRVDAEPYLPRVVLAEDECRHVFTPECRTGVGCDEGDNCCRIATTSACIDQTIACRDTPPADRPTGCVADALSCFGPRAIPLACTTNGNDEAQIDYDQGRSVTTTVTADGIRLEARRDDDVCFSVTFPERFPPWPELTIEAGGQSYPLQIGTDTTTLTCPGGQETAASHDILAHIPFPFTAGDAFCEPGCLGDGDCSSGQVCCPGEVANLCQDTCTDPDDPILGSCALPAFFCFGAGNAADPCLDDPSGETTLLRRGGDAMVFFESDGSPAIRTYAGTLPCYEAVQSSPGQWAVTSDEQTLEVTLTEDAAMVTCDGVLPGNDILPLEAIAPYLPERPANCMPALEPGCTDDDCGQISCCQSGHQFVCAPDCDAIAARDRCDGGGDCNGTACCADQTQIVCGYDICWPGVCCGSPDVTICSPSCN